MKAFMTQLVVPGGMLVKCLDYLRNKGAEWQSVQVFGQEVNRRLLLLHE